MNDTVAVLVTIVISTLPSLLLYLLAPFLYDLGVRLRGEHR